MFYENNPQCDVYVMKCYLRHELIIINFRISRSAPGLVCPGISTIINMHVA